MSSAKIVPNKPCVIFFYGFPGAGKTAFARQLAEEMQLAHLQQDRLSHELFGENSPQSAKPSKNALNYMTREFLRAGVSIIFDTDLPRLADRRALRDEARKLKATPIMVWIQIDSDSAYMRTRKRDRRKADDHFAHEYSMEDYESVTKRMQNPENEDYVVISGKHTYNTQRAAVFKKFYELGILTPNQLSKNTVKPELVNLVPQANLGGRVDMSRRNINIQ